jgi:Txe/YoeB family toxin of Txe-Axe toxin-antitoxin module
MKRKTINKKKANNITSAINMKFIILLVCIVSFIVIIASTIAKYESSVRLNGSIETAFYIISEDYQSMNLNLPSIVPSEEPYIHTFFVANNKDGNRTETNLEYTVQIKTTTNLPLEFELYILENNEYKSIVEDDKIEPDEDGTYFRKITTPKRTFSYNLDEKDIYQLKIKFPKIYNEIDYQNIIEGIEINIDSKQVI